MPAYIVGLGPVVGASPNGAGPSPGTIGKITGGSVATPGTNEGNAKIKYSAEEVETITAGRCTNAVTVESGVEEVQVIKVTATSEAEAAKFCRCFLGAGNVTGEFRVVPEANWKATSAI